MGTVGWTRGCQRAQSAHRPPQQQARPCGLPRRWGGQLQGMTQPEAAAGKCPGRAGRLRLAEGQEKGAGAGGEGGNAAAAAAAEGPCPDRRGWTRGPSFLSPLSFAAEILRRGARGPSGTRVGRLVTAYMCHPYASLLGPLKSLAFLHAQPSHQHSHQHHE